jgi:hypothetical protein
MPAFTITRQIAARVETVWAVLDDFGDIQRWNPGVASSALTSDGPVTEGTTRHCDLTPFGGVNERIDRFIPNERLAVDIYETFKLPISDSIADFNIPPAATEPNLPCTIPTRSTASVAWQRGPPTSSYARGSAFSPTDLGTRASASPSMRRGYDRRPFRSCVDSGIRLP